MSSSDFRQIALGGRAGKAERLFRAAVTAFCSLTRPSRREIAQLEDLTLPLFAEVSSESRRFVAAALSECTHPPTELVRLLCEEPAETAAPLLVRSIALSDIDLIAIIGRHGIAHARAIAARSALNPVIAGLIRALEAAHDADVHEEPAPKPLSPPVPEETYMTSPYAGVFAENARRRLRAMMHGSTEADAVPAPSPVSLYSKLRESALTGHVAFFQTVLADLLEVDFGQARRITESSNYSALLSALRALDLGAEEAFVIGAALFPNSFAHPEGIRLFLERYRLLHPEAAVERVRGWREQALASTVASHGGGSIARPAPAHRPANQDTSRSTLKTG